MVSQWQVIEIKADFVKTQHSLSYGCFAYFTQDNNLLSISNNLLSMVKITSYLSTLLEPERNAIYRNASRI